MIRRLLLILSLLFHVFSLLNAQDVKQHSVALIPYPVTLVEGEGAFVFSGKTMNWNLLQEILWNFLLSLQVLPPN